MERHCSGSHEILLRAACNAQHPCTELSNRAFLSVTDNNLGNIANENAFGNNSRSADAGLVRDPGCDRGRNRARYRGRFAPSPTGALHLGSLLTATASYLDARAAGGEWLLRMEDLDRPREMPGAADAILRSLTAHGLHWDGEVHYQSRRSALYDQALAQLTAQGRSYDCGCSRREVAEASQHGNGHGDDNGDGEQVYPGTCRDGMAPGKTARARRLRLQGEVIRFTDRVFGLQQQSPAQQVGDFVLHRADGIHAYQLAVVVDDAAQGISDVVRGADLLRSTARQIVLGQLLGLPLLRYAHLPLLRNAAGEKLSKQTLAPALDDTRAADNLFQVLQWLGQQPPAALHGATPAELLAWAVAHWRLPAVPRTLAAWQG
jgi:glutamyl-Q tRNA(Asp) synthetase